MNNNTTTTRPALAAYDYDRQQWVSGEEARAVRLSQLKEELALLESPRGAEYLKFTGKAGADPVKIAALVRVQIKALEASAA